MADGVRVHNTSELSADIIADSESLSIEELTARVALYDETTIDAGRDGRVAWTDAEGRPHWGTIDEYQRAVSQDDVEEGSLQ